MEAVKCEAFLAAAELGSLTATAELLGYTCLLYTSPSPRDA